MTDVRLAYVIENQCYTGHKKQLHNSTTPQLAKEDRSQRTDVRLAYVIENQCYRSQVTKNNSTTQRLRNSPKRSEGRRQKSDTYAFENKRFRYALEFALEHVGP